jgi:2-oxoglutarate/2-oxoacid ferredoxin oxidoreductase subunit beta
MYNYDKYLRLSKFPLIWCPGCGDGIVLKSLIRAIHKAGLAQDKVAMVSGIGCSSRLTGYVDFNTLHTTHGRAMTYATGIKMAKPDLDVIVITGDGDATSIGGNHYIHAARRNIGLTVILFNNHIYGMTGGQVSPTTPYGKKGSTAPYGSFENTFNISGLAQAAGASFVARASVHNGIQLESFIVKALNNKGFSLVEVMSPCPTAYGRRNRLGTGADMILDLKENNVSLSKAKKMSAEELEGKLVTGVLIDENRPECREQYQQLIERVHK